VIFPSSNRAALNWDNSLPLTQIFPHATNTPNTKSKQQSTFDALVYLESAGVSRRVIQLENKQNIYCQGDAAHSVMYIRKGGVKLIVINGAGREAVVTIFSPGDFFGEECMAGETIRMRTATAITPTTLLVIEKAEMLRLLHEEREFSDRFIAHILARGLRAGEDLVDQHFNTSEKRLARTLLLLARYGQEDQPQRVLPKLSQEVLAEMIGTTRSRVNYFMNKFRRRGYIKYDGEIRIDRSLLSVVMND
jgi:CRP/FNR family cyclic AMP-dependent transcriptional regulator